jgi:hypothetical protein
MGTYLERNAKKKYFNDNVLTMEAYLKGKAYYS